MKNKKISSEELQKMNKSELITLLKEQMKDPQVNSYISQLGGVKLSMVSFLLSLMKEERLKELVSYRISNTKTK